MIEELYRVAYITQSEKHGGDNLAIRERTTETAISVGQRQLSISN